MISIKKVLKMNKPIFKKISAIFAIILVMMVSIAVFVACGEPATPEPSPVVVTQGTTLDDALSVDGLYQTFDFLEDNASYSQSWIYVRGIVVDRPTYDSGYNSWVFNIADTKDGKQAKVDFALPASGVIDPSEGDTVVVHGYIKHYVSNDGSIDILQITRIVGLINNSTIDSVTVPEKTDADKVAEAKSALTLNATTFSDSFTLPIVGENNATISWALKEANEYLSISGVNATVKKPETNQAVTLVATITVGEVSDTKEFAITISATVQKYTVTFNETSLVTIAVANGEEPITSGSSLNSGTTLTVTVTLKDSTNYELSKVLLNGTELSKNNGVYQFALTSNSTITVETKSLSSDDIGTTANNPYSVEKIVAWTNKLGLSDGGYTDSKYYLRGIVKSFETTDKTTYIKNIYLVDEVGSSTSFLVYSCNFTSEVPSVSVGDTVVVYGAIKNYQGTLEMSNVYNNGTSIHSYPEFISKEVGNGTISVGSALNATVVIGENQTSGKNGTTFTFTVTPDNGYQISAVKVNGTTVSADENGVYIGTISGNTIITVSTSKEGSSSGGGSSSSSANWATDYDGYYASLVGNTSTGATFRSALVAINNKNYKEVSTYKQLTTYFKTTDADPDDSSRMIWWYSGTSVTNNIGTTNREHVWPKNGGSAFPEEQGPSRDLHHMRPTDGNLNSSRSALQFGEVAQTSSNAIKQNGITNYTSAINGGSGVCYKDGSYFYPSEGMRGATARVLMYVQLAWGDEYSLKFVEGVGSNKTIGDIKTLMKWHLEEPPTEFEKLRNERVFGIQGNRNPFVDYPELAERIYCYDGESYNDTLLEVVKEYKGTETLEKIELDETSSVPVGGTIALQATYTPADATKDVIWYSSDTSIATVDEYGRVTGVKAGNATITVVSKENSSISASMTVNVKSIASIEVVGTPTVAVYDEGKTFNPTGLSIKLIYSDNSTGVMDANKCEWFDGTTGKTTLSAGTTTITCKYGNLQCTLTGITVNKISGKVITITKAETNCGKSYDWCTWESGEISGKLYSCTNNTLGAFQMTTTKDQRYMFNTTALPNITKIVITTAENYKAKFEVRTSSKPFDSSSTPYPKDVGTSRGEKSVTDAGTTWTFDNLGDEQYFAISYISNEGSGKAIYIMSIEITYGG